MQFDVKGMSCAACSTRVEKAVQKLHGVEVCSVSLLLNTLSVEGNVAAEEIEAAVKQAGYEAVLRSEKKENTNATPSDALEDATSVIRKRLIASILFLIVLMYFSMGHMMLGWPIPSYFANNPLAYGLVQMILTVVIMVINQHFFINGWKSFIKGAPNMDTLVSLGAFAAFAYSTYMVFAISNHLVNRQLEAAKQAAGDLYFESAAMILSLITIGKLLESISKGRTTDAIKGLIQLSPQTASIIRGEEEQQVPVEEVVVGDLFVIRPGDKIPVDGIIVDGTSAIDESALTGESVPVDKIVGNEVYTATINQSGYLKCKATKVGKDTSLARVIQLVSDASATKAPIAKMADRVAGIFVPTVLVIAVITVMVWLFVGREFGYALARGISVLVISCPCTLGLATPVAIMVGNGLGAKNKIMFKTAVSLEEAGKVQVVALDKTGTLTQGKPIVTDLFVPENHTTEELLECAYALEQKSEHPLSKAICDYAKEQELQCEPVENFQNIPGCGLTGEKNTVAYVGGKYDFVRQEVVIGEDVFAIAQRYAEEGKTPLYFAKEGKFLGIIAVADVLKEDSKEAVRQLQNMGIRVVMITGDNKKTAHTIGKEAGVDEVYAEVLPQGKVDVILQLKQNNKVMMVGDGINDAPALTGADMGVAIGAGTDIAVDAAQIVLMKNRLLDVPAAIRLSRSTRRNIKQNLFWAFIYNIIGIPLAAGVWIPLFGWELNPMFGAAAMSLSSVCVVTNALRLNRCRIYNSNRDRRMKTKKRGSMMMKKEMRIEGMMCEHCQARVKKTLEAIEGVAMAEVDYKTGVAGVTLEKEVSDEILKNAIEEQDYKVISIQ